MATYTFHRHNVPLTRRVRLKTEQLIPLEEALEHLEGVRRDAAMHVLKRAQTRANLTWGQPVYIKEKPVDRRIFDELFVYDGQLVPHVTPRGAETLIFLHEAGELLLENGIAAGRVSTALRIYSTKEAELLSARQPVRAQF